MSSSARSLNPETIQAFVNQLQSFNEEQWQQDQNKEELYRNELVLASNGIADCIDERPCCLDLENQRDFATRNIENPKPSFVGGAGGFVVLYMLKGKSLEEAVSATAALYGKMGWGEMEIHIDDDHGKIKEIEQLRERNVGCGFLNVVQDVVRVLKELGLTDIDSSLVDGEKIFIALKEAGAKTVVLTGGHKLEEAIFAVNDVSDHTLPKDKLFTKNPAFCWDRWATANGNVLSAFNELGNLNLSLEQFIQLQLNLHLATGLRLGALRLSGEKPNLIILKTKVNNQNT